MFSEISDLNLFDGSESSLVENESATETVSSPEETLLWSSTDQGIFSSAYSFPGIP